MAAIRSGLVKVSPKFSTIYYSFFLSMASVFQMCEIGILFCLYSKFGAV